MNHPTTLPQITVLTDPMPWGKELISEGGRRIARLARDGILRGFEYYKRPLYRGHFAVTRSLVEGLNKIDASFNYNPRYPAHLADSVIVLAGVGTLRQAIRLKKQGRIKKLFAGPNIVTFSTDYDSILASPEIDCVITPSDWVIGLYLEDTPSLKERCFAWPSGVDPRYWLPDPEVRRDRILIYEKQNEGSISLAQAHADYLHGLGWDVDALQYGSFTHDQYLEKLKRSCLMIGFSMSESQGIAWAEAWSADVPTLICKNDSNVHRGRRFNCSTAPYLRPENGLFFNDLEDFKRQFAYWDAHREEFTSRDWTLKNMSDEVCASILYKKVTEC